MDAVASLEMLPLAQTLRGSTWLYPLVNAGHIVGIGLLFGAIATLDLRLLGLWPAVPVDALRTVLLPVAAAGLVLAATAGTLLFLTRAGEYAVSEFFQAKMAVLAVAIANAVYFEAVWRRRRGGPRLSAAISLTAWFSVVVLGRLVGYF